MIIILIEQFYRNKNGNLYNRVTIRKLSNDSLNLLGLSFYKQRYKRHTLDSRSQESLNFRRARFFSDIVSIKTKKYTDNFAKYKRKMEKLKNADKFYYYSHQQYQFCDFMFEKDKVSK